MTTITSLPYTINSPGNYELASSLDAYNIGSGNNAITVNADNVTIDGKGYTLLSSAGPTAGMYGIYGLNRSNIVVKNLTVYGVAFLYGIRFNNSDGYTSEGRITVRDCVIKSVGYFGIFVQGNKTIIKDNLINGVGGTQFLTGSQYMKGIEVRGAAPIIEGNIVENVYGQGEAPESVLISLAGSASNAIIFNNIMRNDTKVANSMGLWISQDEPYCQMLNNQITNTERALFGAATDGFAQDNYTFNVGGAGHPMFDIPGSGSGWTGNNMGT